MNLATAQTHLDEWLAADKAASSGSSYSIDGLTLTRQEAPLITSKINYWQKVVNDFIDIDSGRTPGVRVATWD